MNRYTGIKCQHCGKAFQENDQVVVCPDCGAPYHRSCFVEMNGICKFADKHAEGYSWNHAENKKKEELGKKVQFDFWEKYDEDHTVIRFATSWGTKMEDIDALIELL